jgi:hypothetical protein
MWLLHLLPDGLLEFIVNAVLILGIILTLLSFFVLNRILRLIPGLANYHTLIQVVSVIILAAGLYFKGGYVTEMMWREEVKKVQAELDKAKNKAAEVVVQVEEKVVFRDRVVKERGETLIQYVDREIVKKEEVVKYIENCPVPVEIIDIHNQAAQLNAAAKGEKK